MKQINFQDSCINVVDPSQLVLDADDFFRMSQTLSSQNEILSEKEKAIYAHLGERKSTNFNSIIFFAIDLEKIATTVNKVFEDGFELDDEYVSVRSPFDRTIRTRTKPLAMPESQPDLDRNRIANIAIGNCSILADTAVNIVKNNIPLLALSSSYDSETKTR